MNELSHTYHAAAVSFVHGMATSLDWTAKQRGSVTEYEQGYRHALDAILGYLDDLQSGLIEENVLTAKQAMEKK